MGKTICTKIICAVLVSWLWLGQWNAPALAVDIELSKDSTLEGILRRGELRIGLEVGYMPFEMIDKRTSGMVDSGVRGASSA